MEYKVITISPKVLSGKARAEELEMILNGFAAEGWTVKSTAANEVPNFGWGKGSGKTEILVILERAKQ